MNGRVYDPVIGRFLSPDPIVQAPHNSQSFNRYSYVFNNPLSYVDPTGYETDPKCPDCHDRIQVYGDEDKAGGCTDGRGGGCRTYTGREAEYFLKTFEFFNKDARPSWMKIARDEYGQEEIAGNQHNERIVDYHSETSLKASDDETPWCSSFCNWVMNEDGKTGTNSAAAKSWLDWGSESEAKRGALTIIQRSGSEEGEGYHVGFLVEETDTHYKILGGNQGDKVKESSYSKEDWDLKGYRWPK